MLGDNDFKQLGLEDDYLKFGFKPIEFKIDGNSSPIKQIISGGDYIFAILENNKIYCWGRNVFGTIRLGR